MAKLIVKVDIKGIAAIDLRREIEAARADPDGTNSWVSREDGLNKVLVDDAYLMRSHSDDSFIAFEFVGVED
jgi:hypothetical protein